MRQFPRRAGLSLLGGIAIQTLLYLISVIIGSPVLALALLMPGWLLVYAGRSTDPAWGVPVMVLINTMIYAIPIYAYWKAFNKLGVDSDNGA
jgi:predicted benzoate:H+ symporter BenE